MLMDDFIRNGFNSEISCDHPIFEGTSKCRSRQELTVQQCQDWQVVGRVIAPTTDSNDYVLKPWVVGSWGATPHSVEELQGCHLLVWMRLITACIN